MRVLIVNAGSSSLKLRVLGSCDAVEFSHDLKISRGRVRAEEVRRALEGAGTVDAVGHRVVHGGTAFREPVLVDAGVVSRLRELTDLAPLHQPKSLAALAAVSEVLPDVPAVACFDTAFHAAMPAAASTYAIPAQWRQRWALRKYGFHGLSHAWAARRAAELAGRAGDGDSDGRSGPFRVVTAHLGAGASLAAVRDGRSVDTTMGFTPLDGLVMATRSGSLDPGLVLWLQEHVGTPSAELAATLEHRSGLLGLAGSADMREILVAAGAAAGEDSDSSGPATTITPDDACLALDVYVHRLRAGIGAMAAALDGLDALVFTGGVGENSPAVRRLTVEGLGFLGLGLDAARNADPGGEGGQGDRDVSAAGSRALTFVVESREDLEIARSVRALLDPAYQGGLPEECTRAA